jgi:D-aminopeptidase
MFLFVLPILFSTQINGQNMKAREYGILFGKLKTGVHNAITDVPGVKIGHFTLVKDSTVRTGVTAIIPHSKNIYTNKVPAAIYVGNGFGKLVGTTQIEELGNLETPILLTNTLNVATGINALITHTLKDNPEIRSVNGVVGETNDGYLNDIAGRHLEENDFLKAIEAAAPGPVKEGNVGAGMGTICFGYKGGIGTSSRKIISNDVEYHIGVLVQTNFGGQLRIGGIPVNNIINKASEDSKDGSCMIIVATDAPLLPRNLKRLAKRAMLGLARTGGIASNGSGDYVIAFSNYQKNLISHTSMQKYDELGNGGMTPLFQACIEATEEAIINSLFAAETMTGYRNRTVYNLPIDIILKELKVKGMLNKK